MPCFSCLPECCRPVLFSKRNAIALSSAGLLLSDQETRSESKKLMAPGIKTRLDLLQPGQQARVDSFTDQELALKLMEMGCLPGEYVCIEKFAPLGDPLAVSVSGYLLGLRREEAATVIVVIGD